MRPFDPMLHLQLGGVDFNEGDVMLLVLALLHRVVAKSSSSTNRSE
jgi:hypothetical protein